MVSSLFSGLTKATQIQINNNMQNNTTNNKTAPMIVLGRDFPAKLIPEAMKSRIEFEEVIEGRAELDE